MQSYHLFILTLAVKVHSVPRNLSPEEWARQQNDQRFNQEAYHGLPWEKFSKQGFSPRESQRRLRLPNSNRQNALPPTLISDDLTPTKTDPMSLMRRELWDSSGCSDTHSNCFTYSCKLLDPQLLASPMDRETICLPWQQAPPVFRYVTSTHRCYDMLSSSASMVVAALLGTTAPLRMGS